jgi:uncharacterized protein YjbJ (UPF0337 family)
MSDDKAAQAREGLVDGVTGKAKEVAGAVRGKDDLVQEGRLQQEEARNRREAVAGEAVADAERDEAAQEVRETGREATEQKDAARAHAEREGAAVEQQREREHAAAERDAARQAATGAEAAEQQADDVAGSRLRESAAEAADARSAERDADAERARLEREADAADQQAAQLRAQTEK